MMEQNNWLRCRENGVEFYRDVILYVVGGLFAVVNSLSHQDHQTSTPYIYNCDAT
jgi:hypothetical protein